MQFSESLTPVSPTSASFTVPLIRSLAMLHSGGSTFEGAVDEQRVSARGESGGDEEFSCVLCSSSSRARRPSSESSASKTSSMSSLLDFMREAWPVGLRAQESQGTAKNVNQVAAAPPQSASAPTPAFVKQAR